MANNSPNLPSTPAPADGSLNNLDNLTLSWIGGDPERHMVTYDVYLESRDNTPDILVAADQSDASTNVGNLDPNTHYFWRVVARDEFGATTIGPVWHFVTDLISAGTPTNTPTSISPTATPTPTPSSIPPTPTFTPVSPTATDTPVPPTVTSTPKPNTPPVANDQSVSTAQNTAKNVTLTVSDVDNDPLSYSVVTNPAYGILSGTAPNLTYTPNPGFTGSDSFTFKANDGNADSNIATISIAITASGEPPSAPSNLQATALDPTRIRLEWQDNSTDETGFVVYEGDMQVNTVGVNTTSYTVQGLVPNSPHCYRIYAFNEYGNSAWSNSACTTTLPLPTIRFDSSTFSVNESAGAATITVILSAASEQNVSVNYATSDGTATAGSDYTAANGTLTFNPDQTSTTFTVPITDDTFNEPDETISLTLANPANAILGTPSSATLTILANGPCNTPETPNLISPSNNTITSNHMSTFDWDPTNNANEYQLQVDNNTDFSSPEIDISTSNSDYTPSSGLNDGVYRWRVRGRNTTNGCDTYGAWSSTWTLSIAQAPSAPTNVQATALSLTQIQVNWADNANNETGFYVNEGSALFTVGPNTLSYTHEGLEPNSYHCYSLAAFNDFGVSIWTDWVCIDSLPCARKFEGDANCDGTIDLIDYEIWRKESTGELNTKTADFNGDGVVDITDFNIWQSNYPS